MIKNKMWFMYLFLKLYWNYPDYNIINLNETKYQNVLKSSRFYFSFLAIAVNITARRAWFYEKE